MIGQLFYTFFKIGAFTFGSGYAMIPLIEREIVTRRQWFTKQEFWDQFTIAQSAPGPFSLNTAVFVGYRMRGTAGAVAAVAGLVLPPFIIMFIIAACLADYRNLDRVEAAFKGIRPCVVALIAMPFVQWIVKLRKPLKIGLVLLLTAVLYFTGCSPVWFILAAILFGAAYEYHRKP
ncbi:MAG: chromate transporter [Bacteroidales bacterium]|nr:chromate transporter [Bacteroidales bacterium]